ncbi:E3 ubiquitin-protein ligase MPSR1 [Ricinus communis]|uniref:RING-type E3 ubiquitin transferase n=1 Tax=Ricinus communis TaxID=3988 RepID=B9S562_RICCO|nr:E3 ubiquitin-protein ligase MPSR1 [Ricinus communis]EEF41282.1 zinc finger protein, putative [Ricinus communis]|eukprot:XP_002521131.1 E3 ubiquitin-protein ligase MPSR1 [Ricinus communis]
MPFLIGRTQRFLFFEDVKMKATGNNKSTITFTITSDSTHKRIHMLEPDVRLSFEAISITTTNVQVDERDFLASGSDEEAYSKISDLLASLAINPSDKQIIGYKLIKEARILSRRNSWSGCNKLINVEMKLITTYWWQGTVPASCSSVADLGKGRFEEFASEDSYGGERSCSICLEEFQAVSEVKRMPCLHIFHGSCIDQWLNKSHHCPLCRFKMPASCVDLMQ